MRQPKWKQWLSYLWEIEIETSASEHNPHLQVLLSRGRYQLCTEEAVYSFGDLYDNFFKAFKQLPLDHLNIREVLILGLGLGSIPQMLEQNFKQNYHYTAIEIDEEVAYLAQKYVLHELHSPIEVICTDALIYLDQTEATFDLICMDIFMSDVIPAKFEETDFLQMLKASLAPKGVLLYNRLAATPNDKAKSRRFFEEQFLPVFPGATLLDVGPNFILQYCSKAS